MTLAQLLGQLAFCIAGFANKNDDRLMVLLISANVAFALMFAFFQSWTAAALAWMLNNIVIGSVGGILAEGMVLVTNIITIVRLYRLQKKYPELLTDAIVKK